MLSDEEDSDVMTPEPEPTPVTPVIAHDLKVTENEPVDDEKTPCLEGLTSTKMRTKRRRNRRRQAKSSAPRAWRQTAVTFVAAAALCSYAVCVAYFLAARWRQNAGIPVGSSMDQQRNIVSDPGIYAL